MIAVIFDLELMKRFRKGQPSEIVEIGACKVDLGTKKIIDQLQVYILPSKGHISKSTRKFIKMKEEDVEKAVSYQTGIELFKDWLGDEPYYLCSWGKDDRAHFINQSVRGKWSKARRRTGTSYWCNWWSREHCCRHASEIRISRNS